MSAKLFSCLATAAGFVTVFSSVAVAQQFHEVTAEVGLVPEAKTSWGNPIWGDINNDGFLDLIVPTGKLTKAEAISRFKEARAKTLKFIEQTDLPLKAHTQEHPFPVFNTLNAYQWLIYIPLHNLRHNQQIAEVKASPGFPK